MKVAIYGIGGSFNEELAGVAHDPTTALNLLHLIGFTGGSACSLHGPLYSGADALSGEMSLEAADRMFRERREQLKAEIAAAVCRPD